jgi:hypothetical protein
MNNSLRLCMTVFRNKGHPESETPRELARSLLGTRLPFLDPVKNFSDESSVGQNPPIFGNYPIHTLLDDHYIPAAANDAFEDDPTLRDRFNALRRSLVRLAWAGDVDRETLRVGGQILPELINHLRSDEMLLKAGVNPDVAAAAAAVDHYLSEISGHPSPRIESTNGDVVECPLTGFGANPNDIDAQQVKCLKAYQWSRLARLALERISGGIQQINDALDQGTSKAR